MASFTLALEPASDIFRMAATSPESPRVTHFEQAVLASAGAGISLLCAHQGRTDYRKLTSGSSPARCLVSDFDEVLRIRKPHVKSLFCHFLAVRLSVKNFIYTYF